MSGIFDHTKWPWKEELDHEFYKGRKIWPKLSIIIPSFNQGAYIEETILSVLKQNYPNLELIIIDGGSQDNTLDIIRKYESKISYWISENDRGQSHAINKGLEKATGEWVAWLNSDDCYLKNTFHYLFAEINIEPYEFIYGNYLMGESLRESHQVQVMRSEKLVLKNVIKFFFGIDYIIPSQSVFIKSDLLKNVGLLDENLHYCMDVDWYLRILIQKPSVYKYNKTICFFRKNLTTKTGSFKHNQENRMGQEAEAIAWKYYGHLNLIEKIGFRNLFSYYLMYSKEPWKHEKPSFLYLLKLIALHPFFALSDRRVLGLLKRKLL